MTIAEIFFIFGLTNAVLLGAIAYLIKSLTAHFLTKNIEVFKSDLRRESDKSKKQYEILQTVRADKIAELYEKIVNLDNSIRSYLYKKSLDEHMQKKVEDTFEDLSEFTKFYNINRIYFTEKSCQLIDRLVAVYIVNSASFTSNIKDSGIFTEDPNVALKNIRSSVDSIKDSILNDFREIIGVN